MSDIELEDGTLWRPIPGNDSEWDHEPHVAEQIVATLKTLVGKQVLLYGGGSGRVWRMTLRDVYMSSSTWKHTKGRVSVHARLAGKGPIDGKRSFTPVLSSWWIAVKVTQSQKVVSL